MGITNFFPLIVLHRIARIYTNFLQGFVGAVREPPGMYYDTSDRLNTCLQEIG